MRRLTLVMTDEEKAGLIEVARLHGRDPREELRRILRKYLRKQGILATTPEKEPPF